MAHKQTEIRPPADVAREKRLLAVNAAWESFNRAVKPHVRSYDRRLVVIQAVYTQLDKWLDWIHGKVVTWNHRRYKRDIDPARTSLTRALNEARERYDHDVGISGQ
jgi:hypothetical protein